jgi:hypothetical protein
VGSCAPAPEPSCSTCSEPSSPEAGVIQPRDVRVIDVRPEGFDEVGDPPDASVPIDRF